MDHACPGCGTDLGGQTVKGSKLPRVYCSRACMNRTNNRWRSGPDESAALRMSQYSWGEW